jgi:hypothetical protein
MKVFFFFGEKKRSVTLERKREREKRKDLGRVAFVRQILKFSREAEAETRMCGGSRCGFPGDA